MKKLVFGLIATVIISGVSFAQANSKNPHDNVGKLHNDVVASFQAKFAGSGLSISQACAETEKIVNANADILKLNGGKPVKVSTELVVSASTDITNQFKNVIGASKLSAAGKVKTQELMDYMFSIAFSSKYTTYQEFYNYVVSFENGVLADTKLTSSDRSAILSGTSTARYSVYFWDRQYGGQNQPNSAARRGFWGSLLVGLCDAGGAVLGFMEAGSVTTAISTGSAASNAAGEQIDKEK